MARVFLMYRSLSDPPPQKKNKKNKLSLASYLLDSCAGTDRTTFVTVVQGLKCDVEQVFHVKGVGFKSPVNETSFVCILANKTVANMSVGPDVTVYVLLPVLEVGRYETVYALPGTGINHTGTSVPRNTIQVRLNELNS